MIDIRPWLAKPPSVPRGTPTGLNGLRTPHVTAADLPYAGKS